MLFAACLTLLLAQAHEPSTVVASCAEHLADCVDTRRGTDSNFAFSRGNTFVATARPFGFNMWTPVTEPDSHRWLYNYSKKHLLGIAMTHQASPWMRDYGTLQIWAGLDAAKAFPRHRGLAFDHVNESAKPYRYAVTLDNGLSAAVVPTSHAALLTFGFPKGAKPFLILDDIRTSEGHLEADPRSNSLRGQISSRDSSGALRTIYVAGKLEHARIASVERLAGRPLGLALALRDLEGESVTLRLGSSWIGTAEAEASLNQELGQQSADTLAQQGRQAWDEALGTMRVQGGSSVERQIFVNNLYRTLLYPNTLAEGQPSRYRSPYDGHVHPGEMFINNGFWDTYRAVWPLHLLLRPQTAGTMLDGFAQAFGQSGWTPRWSAPGHCDQMVGTHTDAVFADAYVKGVRNFDTDLAWASAVRNAMTTSPRPDRGRPDNHRAPYLGYVPVDDVHEAAAWHLEDCVNDYALGAWAQASGRADDAAYLDQRAASYTNLFSPSVGFFRGKKANGAWRTSDADFSPITWGYEFTEGAPWHYIAPAPFDAQGMARLYGNSPEALADKIDALFEAPKGYAVGSYGKAIHEMVEAQQGPFGQYAHPNEPVHHLVWLYNAVGKPERAQARLRQILDPNNGLYTLGVDNGGGYLGDEDNGQMSAWYVFASAGLYPASPGIPEYSIGSPVFDRVILTLDSGRTFEVIAENNSPEHVYVQYAELNGLPYDKAFLSHADVTAGGTLRLHMGDRPSTWAHAPRLWPTSQTTFPQRPQPLVDRTAEAHVEASPSATPTAALIDDDSSTVWSAQEAQATLWFELPLSAEGPLRQYTLTSAGDRSGCDPTMWRLEGSEDGSTWRTLDSRDDELFPYRYQLRSFALTQPATARHLRLVMQASMAGNCLKLAEVELLYAQDP